MTKALLSHVKEGQTVFINLTRKTNLNLDPHMKKLKEIQISILRKN